MRFGGEGCCVSEAIGHCFRWKKEGQKGRDLNKGD